MKNKIALVIVSFFIANMLLCASVDTLFVQNLTHITTIPLTGEESIIVVFATESDSLFLVQLAPPSAYDIYYYRALKHNEKVDLHLVEYQNPLKDCYYKSGVWISDAGYWICPYKKRYTTNDLLLTTDRILSLKLKEKRRTKIKY